MDLAQLRERVIEEVMRQLAADSVGPPTPGEQGAPAATEVRDSAAIPPETLASARLQQLQKLQATCAAEPRRAVPRQVDVLVVLVGRDEVGDGLAEARALIQQGYTAALVTTPDLLEATGPGLVHEVMNGGPTLCGGGDELARQLVAGARVVLVPALSLSVAAEVAALQSRDFAGQLLIAAIQMGKPVVAARDAVVLNGPTATLALRRKVEEYLQTLRNYGVILGDAAKLSELAAVHLHPRDGRPARPAPLRPAADTAGSEPPQTESRPVWMGNTLTVRGGRRLPDDAPIRPTPAVQALLARLSGNAATAHTALAQPKAPVTATPAAAAPLPDGELARCIDHTLLKPDATAEQIRRLCAEAREYGFAAVCVNSTWVPLCTELLKDSDVRIATVIGFPLGATSTTAKVLEARDALVKGATELDMVIQIGALKSGDEATVREDIRAVVAAAGGQAIVKAIVETGLLTDAEKGKACLLAKEAGAHFVKTATGFGPGGATVADVRLMRAAVGPEMGVKAAGGIRDAATARALTAAGATRIGTSAGVAIVTGGQAQKGKY